MNNRYPDYGTDPDWYTDASGRRYHAKRKPAPMPESVLKAQAKSRKRRRIIGELIFWPLLAALSVGILGGPSDDKKEPVQQVRVDCATGQMLDVLRDGSNNSTACYVVRP